jgi:hypothetical protein
MGVESFITGDRLSRVLVQALYLDGLMSEIATTRRYPDFSRIFNERATLGCYGRLSPKVALLT